MRNTKKITRKYIVKSKKITKMRKSQKHELEVHHLTYIVRLYNQ